MEYILKCEGTYCELGPSRRKTRRWLICYLDRGIKGIQMDEHLAGLLIKHSLLLNAIHI